MTVQDLDLTNKSNIASQPINLLNPTPGNHPYPDYHINPASLSDVNRDLITAGQIT
ncbi:MAG: hypothetical protein AB8W37_09130 [Arsenophonus endosymbiont of Dermacentor nuttalli]